MVKSSLLVTQELLPFLRNHALELGIKVLAKEGYGPCPGSYIVGIAGELVPDARLVRGEFTRDEEGSVTVIWHPVEA